jgi:TldD protein
MHRRDFAKTMLALGAAAPAAITPTAFAQTDVGSRSGDSHLEPARKLPLRRFDVVVVGAGTAGVVLHEAIGHLVESDLVTVGDSPLSSQLGANITSSAVRVVDDPTRRDLPGGFSSDDEGIEATPQPLVTEGRLKGWLSDREGATALESPPGRGRRASWRQPPVARLTNLVVSPGAAEPETMERELHHGLLVTRVGGATVDPVSGRVVLRIERGWEVRHGRRRRPTDGYELTGNVLDVLAHVDSSVGSDPTPDWRLGWCVKNGVPLPTGSEAPSMLFHNLEVL